MNYSEMTDFEINCEVLASLEPAVKYMHLSADQKSFYHCGYDGNGLYETAIPDYCNSWADAGPIIEKNHIDLICYELDACWGANKGMPCAYDNHPLRAAMIVFLMMQESEK